MADRILAAMDYLDAHTKTIPQKLKQRALGDIDGKYSVVDPLLEISYYPTVKNELPLVGVRKANPSNDKPPDLIVEEDRERMVQSAERARSAPAPFKDTNMTSSTRPMTSSSWVTGSMGTRDDERRVPHSLLTSASHASIKRLAFTSPAVKVSRADVRDEIMDEIVNKPLVFHKNNLKSQSAPPSGRIASSVPQSTGTRSARWVVSPKRARTSIHRRRRGARSWEKNPGPFMTVKVTGKDLWVVSNSTPTSYFANNEGDGIRNAPGTNGSKVPKWEDTAESVPKEELASLPRHERLLGAPAQFAPTIHWLRYDPSAVPRKPPVLTPFKEGRYYNLESNQCRKVTRHLDASPGVRIARNGEVLSRSMKLESVNESDRESEKDSESEGGDVDVASLLPAKLASKAKRLYGTPEDNRSEEEYSSDDGGEETESEEGKIDGAGARNDDLAMKTHQDVAMETGKDRGEDREEKEDKENAPDHQSEEVSELSSMSEDDVAEEGHIKKTGEDDRQPKRPLLTKESLALLTKLVGHDSSHPIVDGSNESATSFDESLESYELNDFLELNGIKVDSPRAANGHSDQDDVWRILENATPNFWITKSKQQKLAILKRLRRQRKSEQVASTGESLKSAVMKDDGNEVILPLCWEDELSKSTTKIVTVTQDTTAPAHQNTNTSLPVVFHKTIRYDVLPTATVRAGLKPATVTTTIRRPRSATSRPGEGFTISFKPTRGYRAPVSTSRSNRSVRTKSASTASSSSSPSVRGHSAPTSLVNGTEIIRQSIDLADLLHVTPDSFPARTPHVTARALSAKKEHVTIVHGNVNGSEKLFVQKEVAQNMKNRTEDAESDKASTAPILSPRINDKRVLAPVGTLNFAGIETDTATNDTTTFSSQRFSDFKSSSFTTPQNTPKTRVIHHSVALTPKNSARSQHHPESIRLGVEAVEEGEDYNEAPPLTAKPMSALVQEHNGFARPSLSGRTRTSFASVPASQSRLKSGSSRGAPAHHGVTGSRPVKALPNMHLNFANGGTEMRLPVSAVPLGGQSSTKAADFIQITQSLHISDNGQGDAPAVTGNKMYDSYMRELAAHGGGDVDELGDPKAMIMGRGLGGTSGKSSGFALPRYVKKGHAAYRPSQLLHPSNAPPFTAQAGRRSGLAMVPQDSVQKVGPFGLGVKGDQVRLNIDKNIHNIYRDLGLLKTSPAAKVDQAPISPGRSHVSSARSRGTQKEESVISIPTASEPSVANAPAPSAEQIQESETRTPEETKTHQRPSSSNPSVIVQDSGTQWSSRTVKFEDVESRGDSLQQAANGLAASPSLEETKVSSSPAAENDPSPVTTEGDAVSGGAVDAAMPQKAEESVGECSNSPTSDRSLARAISRASDAVSATESNASQRSQTPAAMKRSASETLLDRLAEMGDRDESSEATEEENDDVDIKGVTRVTVNIPVQQDSAS